MKVKIIYLLLILSCIFIVKRSLKNETQVDKKLPHQITNLNTEQENNDKKDAMTSSLAIQHQKSDLNNNHRPTLEILALEKDFVNKLGLAKGGNEHWYFSDIRMSEKGKELTIAKVFKVTGLVEADFVMLLLPWPRQNMFTSVWLAEKGNVECVITLDEGNIKRKDMKGQNMTVVPNGNLNTEIYHMKINARKHPGSISSYRQYKFIEPEGLPASGTIYIGE